MRSISYLVAVLSEITWLWSFSQRHGELLAECHQRLGLTGWTTKPSPPWQLETNGFPGNLLWETAETMDFPKIMEVKHGETGCPMSFFPEARCKRPIFTVFTPQKKYYPYIIHTLSIYYPCITHRPIDYPYIHPAAWSTSKSSPFQRPFHQRTHPVAPRNQRLLSLWHCCSLGWIEEYSMAFQSQEVLKFPELLHGSWCMYIHTQNMCIIMLG